MIKIAPSPHTTPEMFDADALRHDARWMPVGTIGHSRPLMYDTHTGSWVSILGASGSGTIQRHRHAAPVTAWTLDGGWGYREHDWVARAGSFVYEPAGHIHTLYIHPDVGHMTAVFHIFGPLVYVDADGVGEDYEDVFVRIERYAAYCRSAGIGEDWVRSLIR
jgi:hypothetical protein